MDISGSTVLVTGGAGLIGSHTVDRLLRENIGNIIVFDSFINEKNLENAMRSRKVKIIQGNISDTKDIRAAVSGADFIFHLAARLLRPSARDIRGSLKDNIVGTFNLLEIAGKRKVKKFIFGSSISMYGSSQKPVVMTEDYPLNNRTMYGASKIAGEQFCRVFHDMYGLIYLALRYSGAYGPRQHIEGLYPRLIMHALDRLDKGLPPQIEGNGDDVQDFIYVADVAEANVMALKSDVDDEAINIASGRPEALKELIQTLIDLTDPKLKIEYLPLPDDAISVSRWVSVEKAKKLLGFEAKTSLREGLQQIINWRKQSKLGKGD